MMYIEQATNIINLFFIFIPFSATFLNILVVSKNGWGLGLLKLNIARL